MHLTIEINREYLEKALEQAAASATRAGNAKGINEMIRKIHQQDAKVYLDAIRSIQFGDVPPPTKK